VTYQGDGQVELEGGEYELADRLGAERPVPSAGFRGVLRRHLAARDPGYGPRPRGCGCSWLAISAPADC